MPKYKFLCSSCNKEKYHYTSMDKESMPCGECGGLAQRQFPTINGQQVTEMVDSLTGATWQQDQKEKMHARNENNFWEVEVPRLVQKYSLPTCLENGWLTYNEKGELVIGKPPSRR